MSSPVRPLPLALNDQIVLVTGGGRGLGAHIVRAFLAQGSRVVVNYLASGDAAQALVDEAPAGRAVALQADVRDPEAVARMLRQAGLALGAPVTTVVNNALPSFQFNGDARPQADTLRWDSVLQQLEGSVRGALNSVQAALPAMRAAGFGRVVNILSLIHI